MSGLLRCAAEATGDLRDMICASVGVSMGGAEEKKDGDPDDPDDGKNGRGSDSISHDGHCNNHGNHSNRSRKNKSFQELVT